MGTNSIGLTEWERDFNPTTEQPYPKATQAEMHSAIRAWLECAVQKRPSAAALGQRIADIATASLTVSSNTRRGGET